MFSVETLVEGGSKRGPKPNPTYRVAYDFEAYALPIMDEGKPTALKVVDKSSEKEQWHSAMEEELHSLPKNTLGDLYRS